MQESSLTPTPNGTRKKRRSKTRKCSGERVKVVGEVREGKSVSRSILINYLTRLKIKVPTKKGSDTVDEVALRQLRLKHPQHAALFDKLLEFRQTESMAKFLAERNNKGHLKIDEDGRLRVSYKSLTQTMRWSSAENPMGGGLNAQNIPQRRGLAIRSLYLPDEFD